MVYTSKNGQQAEIRAEFYGNAGFGAWVAYRNGRAVKDRHGKVKVFYREEKALEAARRSRIGG